MGTRVAQDVSGTRRSVAPKWNRTLDRAALL